MFGVMGTSAAMAQAACAKKAEGKIILDTQLADPMVTNINCTGEIKVSSIKNGVPLVATYSDIDGEALSIQADANTQIIISGAGITDFEISEDTSFTKISVKNITITLLSFSKCSALTELDASKNVAIAGVGFNECSALTTLDLSKNTALTNLYLIDCAKLVSISYPATNEDVSTAIAGAITAADAADGTVYTDSAAAYYSTIETAATAKGWTIEQLQ